MTAEQCLQQGDLAGALAALQQQVKKNPADAKLRTFLFQLLAVMGQWQRALTQLNVAGDLDASTLAMVQTYREALRCEVLRKEVFAGLKSPLIFGQPEQWIALLLESLKLTAQQQYEKATELRNQAFDLAPISSGTLNGEAFTWLADADVRLGPMLEAIINGQYYWLPIKQIQTLQLEPPADLRDVVWMPAQFVWQNGGEAVGLIPTRYVDSDTASDHALALARKTEWQELSQELFIGLGQRLLSTDNNEYALMDVREIIIHAV